jgi:voltage-gated potassium channel
MGTMKRIWIGSVGLVVLVTLNTLFFSVVEGFGFIESLYFTVITLTTVGYGDVIPGTTQGMVVALVTVVLGVTLFGLLVGSVTEILVEGQIRRVLGRRKLEKEITALKDHFIVCGFGRIGSIVCRELHQNGVAFVLVEANEDAIRKADEEGYLYLFGDATDDSVLTRAGILRARGLIAVLGSDADNVFVTMSARDLNRRLLIVARGEEERTHRKLVRAGASRIVSPYEIGGLRMAHAILRPNVIDFIEAATRAGTEIDMEELRIREASRFAGKSLADSGIRQDYGLIIVAIRKPDGRMSFNPGHKTVIHAGDVLITMGPQSDQRRLKQSCVGRGTDNG